MKKYQIFPMSKIQWLYGGYLQSTLILTSDIFELEGLYYHQSYKVFLIEFINQIF